MKRRREITTADLNRALREISHDARRENRALGLDTLYVKEGYIVRLDASGREHKIKKLERRNGTCSPGVIKFD